MEEEMKKIFALLLVLVLSLALVSCGEPAPTPDAGTDTGNNGGSEPEGDKIRVCFVASYLGDNSFSDSCANGLRQAERDFDIELDIQQVGDDGVINGVREAAQQGYDLVCCEYKADLKAMLDRESTTYPDTIFYMFDCGDTDYVPNENILSVCFANNECDFVCGAVSAIESKSKVTGWIGGEENSTLYDFLVGWTAGVDYGDPTATTAYSWIAGNDPWNDPAKAKEITRAFFNNYNCDIFHGVAGQSGDGVFTAVNELRDAGNENIWAIGVDSDQYEIFANADKTEIAETILTSAVKHVAKPAYDVIKVLTEGGTPVLGNRTFGIADGVVGAADNEFFRANASKEAQDVLDKINADIQSGDLKVATGYGLSIEELSTILKDRTLNYEGININE